MIGSPFIPALRVASVAALSALAVGGTLVAAAPAQAYVAQVDFTSGPLGTSAQVGDSALDPDAPSRFRKIPLTLSAGAARALRMEAHVTPDQPDGSYTKIGMKLTCTNGQKLWSVRNIKRDVSSTIVLRLLITNPSSSAINVSCTGVIYRLSEEANPPSKPVGKPTPEAHLDSGLIGDIDGEYPAGSWVSTTQGGSPNKYLGPGGSTQAAVASVRYPEGRTTFRTRSDVYVTNCTSTDSDCPANPPAGSKTRESVVYTQIVAVPQHLGGACAIQSSPGRNTTVLAATHHQRILQSQTFTVPAGCGTWRVESFVRWTSGNGFTLNAESAAYSTTFVVP